MQGCIRYCVSSIKGGTPQAIIREKSGTPWPSSSAFVLRTVRRWQLTVISDQHKLTASSHERHKNSRLGGLGSLINENTVKGNCVKNISAGTNTSTTNDLRDLELLHSFLKATSAAASSSVTVRRWRTVDAAPQELWANSLGPTQADNSETNRCASFHQVIHGNIRIRCCDNGGRIFNSSLHPKKAGKSVRKSLFQSSFFLFNERLHKPSQHRPRDP
jgi:hypothetical protein